MARNGVLLIFDEVVTGFRLALSLRISARKGRIETAYGMKYNAATLKSRSALVSEFLGQEYNTDRTTPRAAEASLFREINRVGTAAPEFTLPTVDGDEVTLSGLRGKPVLIEFGSAT